MARAPRIDDLRDAFDPERFDAFRSLYRAHFHGDLQEDPAVWAERLTGRSTEPTVHLLVATEGRALLGGLVCEFYAESCCGLITYVVVEQAARHRGIARALVRRARATLSADASSIRQALNEVFAEVEPHEGGPDAARDRRAALAALGARWLPFGYIQPRLGPGQARVDGIDLVVMREGDPQPVKGSVLAEFMREFYRLTEGETLDDAVLLGRLAHLPDALTTLPPPEDAIPTLTDAQAAVALHLVGTSTPDVGYRCPIFGSFEADILDHISQSQRPIFTGCSLENVIDAELELPRFTTFLSEGRRECIRHARDRIPVRIGIAESRFPDSALSVYHLIVAPREGHLDEYDIVRLARVRPSVVEGVSTAGEVLLHTPGGSFTVNGFLAHQLDQPELRSAVPMGVSIDIAPGELGGGWPTWANLHDAMDAARDGDEATLRALDEAMKDPVQGRPMKALVGVASGIFDFHRMTASEMLDALEPSFTGGETIRIHREHLVAFTDERDLDEAVPEHIGISPYLLIPHAVLLHNEHLLTEASLELAQAGTVDAAAELEARSRSIARKLNVLPLTNVFHYRTERGLYEAGMAGRGLTQGFSHARDSLHLLDQRVGELREGERRRATSLVSVLVGLVTLLEARDFFDGILTDAGVPELTYPVWGGFSAVFAIALGMMLLRGGSRD